VVPRIVLGGIDGTAGTGIPDPAGRYRSGRWREVDLTRAYHVGVTRPAHQPRVGQELADEVTTVDHAAEPVPDRLREADPGAPGGYRRARPTGDHVASGHGFQATAGVATVSFLQNWR